MKKQSNKNCSLNSRFIGTNDREYHLAEYCIRNCKYKCDKPFLAKTKRNQEILEHFYGEWLNHSTQSVEKLTKYSKTM
jgi:hypothetical protein